MSVGYVGLGAMGRALAGHLVADSQLLVWDLNPAAVADFVAKGAQAANSLQDLACRCEIVVLCLPKSANVEQALFGVEGLAAGLKPGAIVVDQTSGDPVQTREFANRLKQQGVVLVDAPVAGGVPSAFSGQITIMVSGPKAAFEQVAPVLKRISPHVHYCSEVVGHGQAVKSINNMANAAGRFFTLEVLAAGRRLGLDAAEITDALNASDAHSFISYRLLPAVVEQKSSTDFALTLMVKDLNLAADLAQGAGVAMPVCDAARGLMTLTFNMLGGDSRLDDVVPFMERATGIPFVGPVSNLAESAPDRSTAIQLVVDAAIAGNRAIIAEGTILARKAGLGIEGFASVINTGSARSAQAEQLFEMLTTGGKPLAGTLRDMAQNITALTDIGAAGSQALILSNQVRAKYLGWIARYGAEAGMNEVMNDSDTTA